MSADLYQDAIVAEAKAKFGAGSLTEPDVTTVTDNPLCGDRVKLEVKLEDGAVADLAHKTRGCLLTMAAMSILARHAKGLDADGLAAMRGQLEKLLNHDAPDDLWPELLNLAPVADVHSRHECVLLPFDALRDAFAEAQQR